MSSRPCQSYYVHFAYILFLGQLVGAATGSSDYFVVVAVGDPKKEITSYEHAKSKKRMGNKICLVAADGSRAPMSCLSFLVFGLACLLPLLSLLGEGQSFLPLSLSSIFIYIALSLTHSLSPMTYFFLFLARIYILLFTSSNP